ncbi:hypothetical protein D9M69_324990 [compost metagenome]
MPAAEKVVSRKNAQHTHTCGSLRNPSTLPPAALAPGRPTAPRISRGSSTWRSTTSTASTTKATTEADASATRQLARLAMVTRNSGAAAQPRFPEMPCTEKAWPSRGCDTCLFSSVKSAGWNTPLPSPATAAPASSAA